MRSRSIISTLLFFLISLGLSAQTITVEAPSRNVLVGESFVVVVTVEGNLPIRTAPDLKLPDALSGRLVNTQSRTINGARSRLYIYEVSSLRSGTFQIPSLAFKTPTNRIETDPITINVYEIDDPRVEWRQHTAGDVTFTFGLATFVPDEQPYMLEVMPLELKVYLPRRIRFDMGNPEIESSGLGIPRFDAHSNGTTLRRGGVTYEVISLSSVVSAREPGPAQIGPGKESSLMRIRLPSQRGFRPIDSSIALTFPAVALDVKPLPDPAPADFARAVGHFEIAATADLSDTEPGDPIAVSVQISGRGNLDTLEVPPLSAPSGWRVYPGSRDETDGVRSAGEGTVTFTQLIRPTETQEAIPPYKLVFFDPEVQQYRTIETSPIALPTELQSVAPAAAAPLNTPSGATAPELAMTQPLGPITIAHDGPTWPPKGAAFRSWWHLVPLAILVAYISIRCLKRRRRNSRESALLKSQEARLARLADSDKDAAAFYREVGTFIESSPALGKSSEAHDLLRRRDELCFDPSRDQRSRLEGKERREVVETLRSLLKRSTILLALVFSAIGNDAQANEARGSYLTDARKAFDSERYSEALQATLAAYPDEAFTADALYNIGVYHAYLDQPGEAALAWRRALALEPNHAEARQNLQFTQTAQRSLVFADPTGVRKYLTYFSRDVLLITAFALFWSAIFLFVLTSRLRWKVVAATVLMLAAAATCAVFIYPKAADFTDVTGLAVITKSGGKARVSANATSASVIETPPGSCVRLIEKRGNWHYVEVPGNIRGWISEKFVKKVL